MIFGKGMKDVISSPYKFGSVCVVTTPDKFEDQMKNQGKKYIWVGNAAIHAVDTYHLINPTTQRCTLWRDVIFEKNVWWKGACEVTIDASSNDINW